MKKAAMETLKTTDVALNRFGAAVKQNLDQITGQTQNAERLVPLLETATLPEAIALLNQIVARIESDAA